MKALSILLLSCWLSDASIAQLSGIYVNKKLPDYRIEFLPNGECFFGHALGDAAGRCTKENDNLICRREAEEVVRFRIEGGVLIDQDGNPWIPQKEIAIVPWKDVWPVTMVVLDRETRRPIPRFSYTYRISTPKAQYDPLMVRPVDVQSENGELTLIAPESCQIDMTVEGENILGGFGAWKSYELTSDNTLRRIEVLVSTGVTVTGTVVEARTGKPIAGALVSSIIFTPPLFTPDQKRAVKTDATGKFTIRGVDHHLGIHVWHPEYLEFGRGGFENTGKEIGPKLYAAQIQLEAGERLVGVVKDLAGKPLAGVAVSDGAGKQVQTAQDGSFVLASPSKWGGEDSYSLSFKKDGYLDEDLHPKSSDPQGFSIVLKPVPVVVGQVLDPQGQPVEAYFVAAGVTLEPRDWCCSSKQIRDPSGRFSLPVRTDQDYGHTGKLWIGVKSAGLAFWDTTIDIDDLVRPVTARLTPGVAIRGSVTVPNDCAGSVSATLLPVRIYQENFTRETSYRQELGRMETAVDAGGEFCFAHVGPGQYILAIAGTSLSPVSTVIAVSNADLDAGTFSLRGTGSVAGVIYEDKMICEGGKCRLDEKRRPWSFAEGHIVFRDSDGRSSADDFPHLKPVPFKADERGQFRVGGVPAGMVSVEIPYMITADVIGTHAREALVLEERTTDVRFFDTSGQWEVVCQFQIGDGSPAQFSSGTGLGAERKVENVTTRAPMFAVQLHPIDPAPTSFEKPDWTELSPENQILVRDVHPGKYRLLINDWLISSGLYVCLYQAAVEAKDGKTIWTIPLGAGCITGAARCPKDQRRTIHVIAVGQRTGILRNAYCDEQGNFCVRYLPEDEYTLWAHDDSAGWCTMPAVTVCNNITDVGSHALAAGGTITGKIPPRWQRDPEATVQAADSHGITIEDPHGWDPIGESFTISHLWPGKWTLRLRRGDQTIAEGVVMLQGAETVSCNLGSP